MNEHCPHTMSDDHDYMHSPEQFIETLERRAHDEPLLPIDDPLAEARDLILHEWSWPSGTTMYCLLRTLTGSRDEYIDGEEGAFDIEGLSIAAALVAAKRIGMYPDAEWARVMDQVEGLVAELDKTAWYSGSDPASKFSM